MKNLAILNLILFSLFLVHCDGILSGSDAPLPLNHVITFEKGFTNKDYATVAYSDPKTNQITHSKQLSQKGQCIKMSAQTLSKVIISTFSNDQEQVLCSNADPNQALSCGADIHYSIKPLKQKYGTGWSIEPSSTPSTNTQCEPFTLKENSLIK